jgi:hypothetical protein
MRKEGFYWVVYIPEVADEWTIAEYWNKRWWLFGLEDDAGVPPDSDFLIGEFIEAPRPYYGEELPSRDSVG